MNRITLLDETLREGEQMPGVTFNPQQKMRIALALSELGVDAISIMPAVSQSDREFTRKIAKQQDELGTDISAACRLVDEEVEFAVDAGVNRIVPFTPLSDLFLKNMRRITREDTVRQAIDFSEYAKDNGLRVFFAGVDSSRADPYFLIDFVKAISPVVENFILCDTLGLYRLGEVNDILPLLKKECPSIGVHMHNDYGLGVANIMEGISAGADLVSSTFNGLGPRAGNGAMEEVIACLRNIYGIMLEDVNYKKLAPLCKLIELESEIPLQANKPIVGDLVYTHESGLHVHALSNNPLTFEPFPPEDFGRERHIKFGKKSGKASIRYLFGDVEPEISSALLTWIKDSSESRGGFVDESEIRDQYTKLRGFSDAEY